MFWIPVMVGIGAVGVYLKKKSKKGILTPERKSIFETALRVLDDADKLRTLADSFEKEGLKTEAEMLRKRAKLRELPPQIREARREAFRKGMASTDCNYIYKLADAFDKEGATGSANELRKHAEVVKCVKPVIEHVTGPSGVAPKEEQHPSVAH